MANKGQLSNRAIKRELAKKIASEAHTTRVNNNENKIPLNFHSSSIIDVPPRCRASKNELHYNKGNYYYIDFQLLTFDRAKPKRKIKAKKIVVKKTTKKEIVDNKIVTKQVNQISLKTVVKFDFIKDKERIILR